MTDNVALSAFWLHLKPTKKGEQDEHDQAPIETGRESSGDRIPVMHKKVVVGMAHLIENKYPHEHKRHTRYGHSVEQKRKTHQMQVDVHVPCVIQREEELGVFDKRSHFLLDPRDPGHAPIRPLVLARTALSAEIDTRRRVY